LRFESGKEKREHLQIAHERKGEHRMEWTVTPRKNQGKEKSKINVGSICSTSTRGKREINEQANGVGDRKTIRPTNDNVQYGNER